MGVRAAALSYQELFDYEYILKVTKNRSSATTVLKLQFDDVSFHHLCGIQKLVDLKTFSEDRKQVFDKIIDGTYPDSFFESSNHYSEILNRIECLMNIRDILDSSNNIYKANFLRTKNSKIKFDYLVKSQSDNGRQYYFVIENNSKSGTYVGCSCFGNPLEIPDYSNGHTSYHVLQKIKKNLITQEETELYIAPSYKKQLEEEAITKTLEADLSSISMLREDIHQNKEDSLDTYFDLRDTFSKSLDTKFKKKTAVKLLKEEYKKADNDEIKSLIQEEIDAIDKLNDSGSPTTMDFRQLPKSPQITVNPNGTVALNPSFHFQPPDFSQLGKKIKKAIKSILPKPKPKKQVHKKAASTAQKTAQKTSSATKSTTQKKAQDKPTEQKKEPVAVAASAPVAKKEARMSMSAVKTVSKNIKKREASSKSIDDRQRSKNDIGIE